MLADKILYYPPPLLEDKIRTFNEKNHLIDTVIMIALLDTNTLDERSAIISTSIVTNEIEIDTELARALKTYYDSMSSFLQANYLRQSAGKSRRKSRRGTRKLNKRRK